MKIPIASPLIDSNEMTAVQDVMNSGILAMSSKVKEFEDNFSEYIGVSHSVSVSNGTVALWLALKAHGIKEGDEVITTPFSFIATSNSVLFCKAKPVFADINERTYNIDPASVLEKITPKTRAVIGVHLFGQPYDLKAIGEICEDNNLIMIEDSAQAHGAEFKGKKVGSFGTGCFSFYPTKNMTAGEGGMVTTNDHKVAEKVRLLRNHGDDGKYHHIMLGYNMRMTDLQAAIGIQQLKKLDEMNRKRITNADYFDRHINLDGVGLPHKETGAKHVYHQYVLKVENGREELMRYLNSKGVGTAIHYPSAIYEQPLYKELGYKPGLCPTSEKVSRQVVSIPVHPKITSEELEYIVDVINNYKVVECMHMHTQVQ